MSEPAGRWRLLGRDRARDLHDNEVHAPQSPTLCRPGWSNFVDAGGEFLLLPPNGKLSGVNDGTSDYIGVYAEVAAPDGCDFLLAHGFSKSTADIMRWLRQNPGIVATAQTVVTIGGLAGQVIDLRLAPGWTQTCPFSQGAPVVPFITGVGRSRFDHVLMPGQLTRLYLLDYAGRVLAIEVADSKDDPSHIADYAAVVSHMKFTTSYPGDRDRRAAAGDADLAAKAAWSGDCRGTAPTAKRSTPGAPVTRAMGSPRRAVAV